MKTYLYLFLAMAACLLSSNPAKAWNCNNPLASRVDVGSTLPSGSKAGDGDGQYYKGPDAQNPNDYYVCQVPKPTPPQPTSTNQKQKQQQTSTSTSSSKSSATGGSVNNSGNSSNTNTNSASAQGGSSSSSNNSTGSGNNTNINSESSYNEVRQNPGSYAPAVLSTGDCLGGISAGASTPLLSGSFGTSRVDKGCDGRHTAILFHNLGNDTAAAGVLCSSDAVKRAIKAKTLTMEQCLVIYAPKQTVVIREVPAPVQQVPPTVIVVPVPQPQSPAAIPVVHHLVGVPAGDCKVLTTVNNICARVIGDNIRRMEGDGDSYVIIKGNGQTITLVSNYLDKLSHKYDLDRSRWHLSVTDEPSVTVQFSFVGSGEQTAAN